MRESYREFVRSSKSGTSKKTRECVHCKLEDKGLVPNPFNSGGWVHSQCLKKLHRPKAPLVTRGRNMESEDERIGRLTSERDALPLQLVAIQIETLKRQVQSLQEAPADCPGEEDIRAQVRDLVGNGRSIRQIAATLHLSRSKVGRIKKKWDTRGTVAGQQ
jgi:hypothetical protein